MSREFDDLLQQDAPLIIYAGSEVAQAAGLPSIDTLLASTLDAAESRLSTHQLSELRELAADEEVPRHELFAALQRDLGPAIYGRTIEKLLDDRGRAIPLLAQAIAELEPRLRGVLTPNIDHLLERAFAGTLEVHTEPVADLPARRGWLYKLHGTLRKHDTWRFTTDQLRSALYRDPLQRALFQSLFLAHPIVFIGTRLDDPVFRDVVEQITALAQGQAPQHWMFVEQSQVSASRRRRLAAAGIELISYVDSDGQHDGCVAMLRELGGGEHEPAPTPPPPPVVIRSAPNNPKLVQKPERQGLAILFASANPAGTDPLRLAREEKIIREAITLCPHRDRLELDTCPAVSFDDLRRALLRKPYDVVHLSGHSETEGLILEDALGDCVQIAPKGLARVFVSYAPPAGVLRCVVLNACYSVATGRELSMDVPYTIAMNGPISDRGALEFSRGFYDALGAGCDIPRAYHEGLTCVLAVTPNAQFDSVLLERPSTSMP